MQRVYAQTRVPYVLSNAECANSSKYVVLAVKPQYYPSVLKFHAGTDSHCLKKLMYQIQLLLGKFLSPEA